MKAKEFLIEDEHKTLSYDEFIGKGLPMYKVVYSIPGRYGMVKRNITVLANDENEAIRVVKRKRKTAKIHSIEYKGVREETNESEDPNVIAIYDNKDYEEAGSVKIYKTENGFYGDTGKFDFERPDLDSLKETLKKWGYVNHVYGKDLINERKDLFGKYSPSISEIANKHGVSEEEISKQLEMGIEVEYEHTPDKKLATEIALDHLAEMPDYYTKLAKIEPHHFD